MASNEITIGITVDGQTAIRHLKKTDAELDKLRKSGTKSGEAMSEAYEEAAQSADKLAESTGKAGEAGGRLSGVKEQASELAEQLRSGDIPGATSSFQALGKSAGVAGVALGGAAVAATAAGSALLYGTAKSIEFEQQMLGVAKTTGMTGSALEGLSSDILDLSGTLGIGRGELAAIAETAGQLGIEGRENIAQFTETVAKLASVSDLTAEEAGSLIAQLSNVFDLPIEQAENLGSAMNELSNTTTARAGQIANAMTRAGQAGASLGLSADQVAALSATLIDAGIEAETAGTSLRNVFTRMRTEAGRVGEVMGMTAEEVDALIEDDALGAVRTYAEALGEMPPRLQSIEISETFGQENTNAVRALVDQTDLLGTNLTTANEAFDAGTSLNSEFASTLEAVSTQWRMLLNNMQAVAIELTRGILPGLSSMLQRLNGLFNETNALTTQFGRLSDELGRVQETERLLQKYEEHVANAEEGTAAFQETVDALAERLPGYAIKQNEAGEAVGVHAEQMRGLVAAQKAAARAAVMENLREQAEAFTESMNDLAEAERTQARARSAINARTEEEVQRLREAYDALEESQASVYERFGSANREAQVFGGLLQDAEDASQQAAQLDAQMDTLARSMLTFYSEMAEAEPGTQAYTDALNTLGAELGLTEQHAEALLGRMQELNAVQNEATEDQTAALDDNTRAIRDNAQAREDARIPLPELGEIEDQTVDAPAVDMGQSLGEAMLEGADPGSIEAILQDGLIRSINAADQAISQLQDAYDSATTQGARNEIQALIDRLQAHRDEMDGVKEDMIDFGPAVEQAANDALVGFGESIGQMAAGAGSIKDVGAMVLTTLADLAQRVGSMLISFGLSMQALQTIITNPVGAVIAGTALVALASAAKAAISSQFNDATSGGDDGRDEIPRFARGVRDFRGGAAIVGEEGPELVNLPSGSDVLSNPETMAMMRSIQVPRGARTGAASGSNSSQTVNVNLKGGTIETDLFRLSAELEEIKEFQDRFHKS